VHISAGKFQEAQTTHLDDTVQNESAMPLKALDRKTFANTAIKYDWRGAGVVLMAENTK